METGIGEGGGGGGENITKYCPVNHDGYIGRDEEDDEEEDNEYNYDNYKAV